MRGWGMAGMGHLGVGRVGMIVTVTRVVVKENLVCLVDDAIFRVLIVPKA